MVRTENTPCGGEGEGGLDEGEWDASVIELSSELAIGSAHVAGGGRRGAVALEHCADVLVFVALPDKRELLSHP
jgi:hypothetical protein